MQHEIPEALTGDAEILGERASQHRVLVERERLDATVRGVREPPVDLVDDQQHLAVVPAVVRLEDGGEARQLPGVEHVPARVGRRVQEHGRGVRGQRGADAFEIETEVRPGRHRDEPRRGGLAVQAELREVRGDPDDVVTRVHEGADRDVDRGGRTRRHRDRVARDARKLDILCGALAHLRVAEVRHVAEAPAESLAACRRERLDDGLRRFQRLADGEIGHRLLAEFSPEPLALHEHAPDPAAVLELCPGPPRDGHLRLWTWFRRPHRCAS